MHYISKRWYIIYSIALLYISGCKKLIEVDLPIDRTTPENVFGNTGTAVAAMSGIYAGIGAPDDFFTGELGLSIRIGFTSDELTPNFPQAYPEYLNNYSGVGWNIWIPAFRTHIFRINSLIEGVALSTSLSGNIKKILNAEALFTRAWVNFYLVNLYGDIPLVTNTDYKKNANISRSSVEKVYDQIVSDLLIAQADLPDYYVDKDLTSITDERIRPNKSAATALLARVYLYRQNWSAAESEATKVIDNAIYELQEDLNAVFLKNNKEAIWQLQPNSLDQESTNTPDGRWLINPFGGDPFFHLSSYLINAFEPDDLRKEKWVKSSNSGDPIAYKYKEGWSTFTQSEYTMVLRLAEQYLIRAEARTNLNKLTGVNSAQSDLNAIRLRAGLLETTANTQEALLNAISQERQVELFMEWGHRWLDLKRSNKVNDLMRLITPEKGGSWSSFKALLPIPYDEFMYNPSLRGKQNPGYQEQP